MIAEDDENTRNNNHCSFREKEVLYDKLEDHCHLTSKYRGPAHNKCIIKETQIQCNFNPIIFYSFRNYDFHLFSK